MNLLHKDFHCKNILVDKEESVVISDFGLCQPIDSEIGKKKFYSLLHSAIYLINIIDK